jgi:hypothetical protein
MFDRGFITHNMGLGIFNMAPITDGDKLFIRREYVEVSKLGDIALDKEAPVVEPVADKEDTEDDNNEGV